VEALQARSLATVSVVSAALALSSQHRPAAIPSSERRELCAPAAAAAAKLQVPSIASARSTLCAARAGDGGWREKSGAWPHEMGDTAANAAIAADRAVSTSVRAGRSMLGDVTCCGLRNDADSVSDEVARSNGHVTQGYMQGLGGALVVGDRWEFNLMREAAVRTFTA
jgi:hypothetical protein